MIKNPKRYREQSERERAKQLRKLTYRKSIQMAEDLMSCGLLEQLNVREADRPVALRYLLHDRTK